MALERALRAESAAAAEGGWPFSGGPTFGYPEKEKDQSRGNKPGDVVWLAGGIMPGPFGNIPTPTGWAMYVGAAWGQPHYQLIPEEIVRAAEAAADE